MSDIRILAVDDDTNQLASLRRILKRSHFEVITCEDPKQGLHLALTEKPDLILLDVCMPGMSGHEFLRRLRHAQDSESATRMPVVFLSGLSASHQRISGLDAGAVDYITKPFDADELRARIRAQLRHSRPLHPQLHKEDVRSEQLESTLQGIATSIRASQAPLVDISCNLELAGLVRQPSLQKDLLVRTRRDLRRLADSLRRIADLSESMGNLPDAESPGSEAQPAVMTTH